MQCGCFAHTLLFCRFAWQVDTVTNATATVVFDHGCTQTDK